MPTTEAVAEEFGVKPTTVTKWIREGRIPATLLPGRWIIPEYVIESIRQNGMPPKRPDRRPVLHRERVGTAAVGLILSE